MYPAIRAEIKILKYLKDHKNCKTENLYLRFKNCDPVIAMLIEKKYLISHDDGTTKITYYGMACLEEHSWLTWKTFVTEILFPIIVALIVSLLVNK